MGKIVEISACSNNKKIQTVITDDLNRCWFNRSGHDEDICIMTEGNPKKLLIEFQKGFQPKFLEVVSLGKTIGIKKEMSNIVADIDGAESKIVIRLKESYDPYGRVCIYTMKIIE